MNRRRIVVGLIAGFALVGCGTTRRDVGLVADPIGPGSTRIQPAIDARNGFVPANYANQTAQPNPAAAAWPSPATVQPQATLPPAGAIAVQPGPAVGPPPGYAAVPAPVPPIYQAQPAVQPAPGLAPIPYAAPALAIGGPGTGSVFIPSGNPPPNASSLGSAAPGTQPTSAYGQNQPALRVSSFLSETDFSRRGLRLHPRIPEGMPTPAATPTPLPNLDNRGGPRPADPPGNRRREDALPPGPLTTPPPPAESAETPRRRAPGGPEFEPPRQPGSLDRRQDSGLTPKAPSRNPALDDGIPDFRAPSKQDLSIPEKKKSG